MAAAIAEFDAVYEKFILSYHNAIFAVNQILANPKSHSSEMLTGCVQMIENTCVLADDIQTSKKNLPQNAVVAAILVHLQSARNEICDLLPAEIQQQIVLLEKTPDNVTALAFSKFMEAYNKTISSVDKIRQKGALRKMEELENCVKEIDNNCSMCIVLPASADIQAQYTAIQGMLEHLKAVKNEILALIQQKKASEPKTVAIPSKSFAWREGFKTVLKLVIKFGPGIALIFKYAYGVNIPVPVQNTIISPIIKAISDTLS